MSLPPTILAFAGSAREASYNKKLIRIAAAGAEAAGARVTLIDLRDFPMPLYDGDLEKAEGVPERGTRLRELIAAQDGLLISAPEYNSSITPLLKNCIDWTTRIGHGEATLDHFKGKVAILMSASPGMLGGMRGLVHLRAILSNIGVWVLPDTRSIRQAAEAFDEGGGLKDAKAQKEVEALGGKLADILRRLKTSANEPAAQNPNAPPASA